MTRFPRSILRPLIQHKKRRWIERKELIQLCKELDELDIFIDKIRKNVVKLEEHHQPMKK